jgi:hypothetical protein
MGGWILAPSASKAALADPWAGLDGRLAAPTGSAQYPNYFTNLNGISPYPVRPPWRVAGVDYRVGVNTGVSLKDPNAISAAVAVKSGSNPFVLNLQQSNITLDGYDFTTGGWWQIHTNGNNNLTISNSKLQNLCIIGTNGDTGLTVKYCEIDGLGAAGETVFGALAFLGSSVTSTWLYNWIHDSEADMLQVNTVDMLAKYNLFDTMGYSLGAHSDAIQFGGPGTANNVDLEFNTYVQRIVTTEGPSSFLDVEVQTGGTAINNPIIAYNTASYTATGGITITGAANNGSGGVRLTLTDTTNLATNGFKLIYGIVGTTEANGEFFLQVIDGTHVDLFTSPGSPPTGPVAFVHAYVSGGTLRALGSTFYRIGGGVSGAKVHDNYADQCVNPADPTGNDFMLGVFSDGGVGTIKSGNILLNTGGSF